MTTGSQSSATASRSPATPPLGGVVATAGCLVAGLIGWVLAPGPVAQAAFVVAYLAGGAIPGAAAFAELRRGRLGVDLLMILAAIGAAVIGDWGEGTVLLFLFSLSGTLEAFAMFRTRRSIESLMALRPEEASRLLPDGDTERVAVAALAVGDQVLVRPGERLPVDGEVAEGESWVDEATITGESVPVGKRTGASVFAGTLNGAGTLRVSMTRAAEDSTLERIVRLVQEAQAEETPTQRFVESWQQPYVLSVVAAATFTWVVSHFLRGSPADDAFYHAMVLLVAASPCAVVLSSPAVMLSAIARAGRQGVLFKGGVHLESLARVDLVAFDKTGTLTTGQLEVVEVWAPDRGSVDRLLSLAAGVEVHSEHPLGAAVVAATRARGLPVVPAGLDDFDSHTGLGVHGRVGGVWVGVGREALFVDHGLEAPSDLVAAARRRREAGDTALLVMTSEPGVYGVIAVADRPRADAAPALAALTRLGVPRLAVLTGDHRRVAEAVAAEVGASEVHAGLLPHEKVAELRRLATDCRLVAMVGDGVNDAPALAAAGVGIAMGGAGTDVALEVADVVLMRDDLGALAFAVWLSRQAIHRVRQNLGFAFGMIGLLVLSSFFGLPLWVGVVGHEGSTLLVVLNGLRMLWVKPPPELSPPAA